MTVGQWAALQSAQRKQDRQRAKSGSSKERLQESGDDFISPPPRDRVSPARSHSSRSESRRAREERRKQDRRDKDRKRKVSRSPPAKRSRHDEPQARGDARPIAQARRTPPRDQLLPARCAHVPTCKSRPEHEAATQRDMSTISAAATQSALRQGQRDGSAQRHPFTCYHSPPCASKSAHELLEGEKRRARDHELDALRRQREHLQREQERIAMRLLEAGNSQEDMFAEPQVLTQNTPPRARRASALEKLEIAEQHTRRSRERSHRSPPRLDKRSVSRSPRSVRSSSRSSESSRSRSPARSRVSRRSRRSRSRRLTRSRSSGSSGSSRERSQSKHSTRRRLLDEASDSSPVRPTKHFKLVLKAIEKYSEGELGQVKKSRKKRKLSLKSDIVSSDSDDAFVGVTTASGVRDALEQWVEEFKEADERRKSSFPLGDVFRASAMHPSTESYKSADSTLRLQAAKPTRQFFEWMPKSPPKKFQLSDADAQYLEELARLSLRVVNMRELLHQVQNCVDSGEAPAELAPILHKSSLAANKDLLKIATCQLGAIVQLRRDAILADCSNLQQQQRDTLRHAPIAYNAELFPATLLEDVGKQYHTELTNQAMQRHLASPTHKPRASGKHAPAGRGTPSR